MSGEAFGWALDQDLPAEEKFLLAMIADNGGSDDTRQFTTAWASKRCGLEKARAVEIIEDLRGLGLLVIRYQPRTPDERWDVWLNHDFTIKGRPGLRRDTKREAAAESFVYIAQGAHGGLKIGLAIDVVRRRRTLEHSAGCSVEVLWYRQFSTEAARKVERAILIKFTGNRRYGEWLNGVDTAEVLRAAEELSDAPN